MHLFCHLLKESMEVAATKPYAKILQVNEVLFSMKRDQRHYSCAMRVLCLTYPTPEGTAIIARAKRGSINKVSRGWRVR